MPTAEEIDKAFKELLEESNDRAVAIVGAALLEAQLEEAILRRLLPMSTAHRDALFRDEYGYTFASKIDLGLSLGLYGNKTKTDLHRIKKIRNEFAHNLDRDFCHEKIIKACKDLTNYSKHDPFPPEVLETIGPLSKYLEGREWRWRYIHAISFIGLGFLEETIKQNSLPPRPIVLND